jgi:hypothetical protein
LNLERICLNLRGTPAINPNITYCEYRAIEISVRHKTSLKRKQSVKLACAMVEEESEDNRKKGKIGSLVAASACHI